MPSNSINVIDLTGINFLGVKGLKMDLVVITLRKNLNIIFPKQHQSY